MGEGLDTGQGCGGGVRYRPGGVFNYQPIQPFNEYKLIQHCHTHTQSIVHDICTIIVLSTNDSTTSGSYSSRPCEEVSSAAGHVDKRPLLPQ